MGMLSSLQWQYWQFWLDYSSKEVVTTAGMLFWLLLTGNVVLTRVAEWYLDMSGLIVFFLEWWEVFLIQVVEVSSFLEWCKCVLDLVWLVRGKCCLDLIIDNVVLTWVVERSYSTVHLTSKGLWASPVLLTSTVLLASSVI